MKNILYVLILCSVFPCAGQLKYPATKTVDSADTYFGTTYKDPYRWLENVGDSSVAGWFKQQAELSNSLMATLNGRDELIAEWKRLDKLQPPRFTSRVKENSRIFYRKTMPGEKIGKLYYREAINEAEQLLFDPSTYIKGRELTIESVIPTYDAKLVAIGYSEAGAEVSTIKVMDVDTKKFLKDEIYPSTWAYGWTFDNKALLYGWIKSVNNADPEARLNPKTKLHFVGQPATSDVDFFSNESYPELKIDPKNYPFVFLTTDNKNYIFGGESSVQQEMSMMYAPIEQFHSGKIQWKVLCTPADKLVRGMEIMDDNVYAITYEGAKNYKLISTSLKNPNWKTAKTIAPEKKDQTLEQIFRTKDYLILNYSDGINGHMFKYDPATAKVTEIKLPFSGTVDGFCLDKTTNKYTVGITSWTKPRTEFEFDGDKDGFSPGFFNRAPAYPEAFTKLMVEEVEVKGHDGIMIPLSIIYKSGTKLSGNNVCLMNSYGAYGSSMSPWFDLFKMTLATKGAVIAIPHVRGGSEKGEEWYRAGFKTTKPNTWKDFNSCAEYLIAKGYTKPSMLSGTGTSAGGILITRAITERPDLYAAAICNVGCANALRLEFSANGPVNVPEFGTVKDSIESKALYEMDGLQHVVPGTKYPAVMAVGGWNDPRVVAWQPGKFAASMQQASTSGRPVLLKVNYDNGHFTQDKDVTYANFADQLSFAMWQCGHPDFQPKKLNKASVDIKR